MGNNFAVVYACLFLCHLEKEVNRIIPSPEIKFFKRFIDDGFLVWFGSLKIDYMLTSYAMSRFILITFTSLLIFLLQV